MITHNGLIDLSLLLDQHLLAEQSLNKEWDREVDVAIHYTTCGPIRQLE